MLLAVVLSSRSVTSEDHQRLNVRVHEILAAVERLTQKGEATTPDARRSSAGGD